MGVIAASLKFWEYRKAMQLTDLDKLLYYYSITNNYCRTIVHRKLFKGMLFHSLLGNIEQASNEFFRLNVVSVNDCSFILLHDEVVGLIWIPKWIPNSSKRNVSNMLFSILSQMLSYFINQSGVISKISVQELLLLFNWTKIVRYFDSQSSSIKSSNVPLVELIRTKKELPATHTNSLGNWISSKQRMNSLVVHFETNRTSFLKS